MHIFYINNSNIYLALTSLGTNISYDPMDSMVLLLAPLD